MAADEDEEKLLRSVALQNAKSILAARQRAERELIESKEVVEHKTEELAQANRRLLLLNQVANALMLGEMPQEQLKTALDAVAQELGAKYYFNYRIDEKDPDILILGASGGLDEAQEHAFRRIGFGQHLCGQVAQSRSPLTVENVHLRRDEPTAGVRAMGIKAYAGLPLLAHDRLFGTIAFGSVRHARFSEADLELLKTLADQFAATLDRARLLQSLRESEARYRLALKAGRMGTWETDFVTGTRTWSDEGMALFGLTLVNGRGHIGGDTDEFTSALHPADRPLVQHFHQLADKQDAFAAEYRIVQPGGKIIWLAGRGQVVTRGADGKALRLVNIVTEITERKAAEDHIQLLMREISHRSKNLLSVVQAIASQTVRTADTMEEFETRFGRRLQGLAASHDLLVHEGWRGAPLADLVHQHLAPFAGTRSSRLELAGPDVVVTTEAAQAIGLALHELATNAIKYGALAGTTGKVTVSWAFDNHGAERRRLRLRWVESGGPPVAPPFRKGFGHVVIESLVAQSVNGEVAMKFEPQGLSWSLSMPETNLVSETRESTKLPLQN
jgi:two-component sensor histidine kinase/PAS domain-containing protein